MFITAYIDDSGYSLIWVHIFFPTYVCNQGLIHFHYWHFRRQKSIYWTPRLSLLFKDNILFGPLSFRIYNYRAVGQMVWK